MIGLGAQYLMAAGFGRYKITAASLGNLDLFRAGWLKYATVQAILGAFGDDGMAVIKATNAYLNGIAASDRDKAQQIADWLNAYAVEDAKIVYSLVPTLGKRYLTVPQGSGKGYKNGVTLAYAWSDIGRIDMYFQLVQSISSNGVMLFNRLNGASLTAPYYGVGWNSGFNNMVVTGGTTYTEEGERTYSFTCSNTGTYAHMFGWDAGIVHVVRFTHISVYGTDKTTKLMEIVPYIKDGESVCLDLLSGSIIRNNDVGSFAISETPSTP